MEPPDFSFVRSFVCLLCRRRTRATINSIVVLKLETITKMRWFIEWNGEMHLDINWLRVVLLLFIFFSGFDRLCIFVVVVFFYFSKHQLHLVKTVNLAALFLAPLAEFILVFIFVFFVVCFGVLIDWSFFQCEWMMEMPLSWRDKWSMLGCGNMSL